MADQPARSFVFYDPTGKRWSRFRRAGQTFGIALFLLLALFLVALFANYKLPSIGLPESALTLPAQGEVRSIIKGQKISQN